MGDLPAPKNFSPPARSHHGVGKIPLLSRFSIILAFYGRSAIVKVGGAGDRFGDYLFEGMLGVPKAKALQGALDGSISITRHL